MTMQYLIEYCQDEEEDQDPGCFIHLKLAPLAYQKRITKEAYDLTDEASQSEWMTGIFNIGGVTEASSQGYRVWITKSPAFTWDEVLQPLLFFMKNALGESNMEELPGSGMTLPQPRGRKAP